MTAPRIAATIPALLLQLLLLSSCVATSRGVLTVDAATARTWSEADVLLPAGLTRSGRAEWRSLEAVSGALRAEPMAVPLYLDAGSCTGRPSPFAAVAFASGYVVISPASFARGPRRIARCDAGADADEVLRWRVEELRYALDRSVTLPWVDGRRIVVGGHGEGAEAVAAFGADRRVAARLVSGIGCAGAASLLDDAQDGSHAHRVTVMRRGACPGLVDPRLHDLDPDGGGSERAHLHAVARAVLGTIAPVR